MFEKLFAQGFSGVLKMTVGDRVCCYNCTLVPLAAMNRPSPLSYEDTLCDPNAEAAASCVTTTCNPFFLCVSHRRAAQPRRRPLSLKTLADNRTIHGTPSGARHVGVVNCYGLCVGLAIEKREGHYAGPMRPCAGCRASDPPVTPKEKHEEVHRLA